MESYDYALAFSRNIGWVTPEEQQALRASRVAIGGLGGVGGIHALTMARLGIGRFHIADFDTYSLANMNRQAGAFVSTLGQPKADVIARMVRDINPEADIHVFPDGVREDNVQEFLSGVDVYVDGIDYFAVGARRMLFRVAAERKVPAVTAAPLGMGTAVLTFLPGGMTFEEYFRLEGHPEQEQLIRFLIGLSPRMLQRSYLAWPAAVNLEEKRGPSTPMACELCAGVLVTQVLKVLLRRGGLVVAPWGLHLDAYRNKLVKTWRPWGNNNPIQRVALMIARQQLRAMRESGALERR